MQNVGELAVGREIDLGGMGDSGPPAPYVRGLNQRSTKRNSPVAWAAVTSKLFAGYHDRY